MSDSRYVVGIDLGTTNTVISYCDAENQPKDGPPKIEVLAVPQVVAPGVVEPREVLPSFLYLPAGPEFAEGALDLPWGRNTHTVGALAREQGNKVPARVVSSAKSWLCHTGVDRTSPLLPWQAPEEVPKISPLDASSRLIEHLRDGWNHVMAAEDPFSALESQEIYLTVPASFDAVARELTLTAAKRAGLLSVTLLEEPQAAFYAWLAAEGNHWRKRLKVGDRVLVCDVGGGTTDFSLIAVEDHGGDLQLDRVAVGEHILLGGDNMDLALAVTVSERLGPKHKLDPWQTRSLWHACRVAKEQLFVQPELEKAPVSILGRGSKVIGGTIKADLLRSDLEQVLLEGFFPTCAADERPAQQRRIGLQEIGLPYATDAGITRHLARFVGGHMSEDRFPTAVLFNGGVMKASSLRERFTSVLKGWRADGQLRELSTDSLDLAVSRGAAYYGQVRRGKGIRIRGGVARSYYIGIESAMPAVPGMPAPLKALCVVPFGMEEGTEAAIAGKEFGMVVGEPVEFRFLSSTTRKDGIGTMLDNWADDEIEELAPIQTAIEGGGDDEDGVAVPVRLHTHLTEVGTLDLQLRARDERSWKLEYNVREPSK